MMYRYIFDIGGVLVKYNREELLGFMASSCGCRPDDVRSLFAKELVCMTEIGAMPFDEYYEKHVKRVMPGIRREDWLELYEDYFRINPEGFELMQELKNRGRKVYILSNLADYHKIAIERKIPGFFDHADHNFLSYELGCRKPEPGIYRTVCGTIGTSPEKLVFFDDMPENVEGARMAGINGILFSNERIEEIRDAVEAFERKDEGEEDPGKCRIR